MSTQHGSARDSFVGVAWGGVRLAYVQDGKVLEGVWENVDPRWYSNEHLWLLQLATIPIPTTLLLATLKPRGYGSTEPR